MVTDLLVTTLPGCEGHHLTPDFHLNLLCSWKLCYSVCQQSRPKPPPALHVLSMLALADLGLSVPTTPGVLCSLPMGMNSYPHVPQLFLISFLTSLDSAVLFAMPLVQLMASCPPPRAL